MILRLSISSYLFICFSNYFFNFTAQIITTTNAPITNPNHNSPSTGIGVLSHEKLIPFPVPTTLKVAPPADVTPFCCKSAGILFAELFWSIVALLAELSVVLLPSLAWQYQAYVCSGIFERSLLQLAPA